MDLLHLLMSLFGKYLLCTYCVPSDIQNAVITVGKVPILREIIFLLWHRKLSRRNARWRWMFWRDWEQSAVHEHHWGGVALTEGLEEAAWRRQQSQSWGGRTAEGAVKANTSWQEQNWHIQRSKSGAFMTNEKLKLWAGFGSRGVSNMGGDSLKKTLMIQHQNFSYNHVWKAFLGGREKAKN